MIELKITQQEAQTLLSLLDLAVKSGGLAAALVAVPLHDKVQDAAQKAGGKPCGEV